MFPLNVRTNTLVVTLLSYYILLIPLFTILMKSNEILKLGWVGGKKQH